MAVKYDETIMMRRLLIEHTIGYVRVNVYKPAFPIKWADVNDREMIAPRGTKMMKSFIAHGIESTLIERTIRVAMRPEWLTANALESPEGLKIMELPILTLTAEGTEAANAGQIRPVEGMGRRGGVEGYCAMVAKQITALKSKIDRLKGDPSDVTRHTLMNTKAELERHLEESSWWTFRVLNKGEGDPILIT
jgi:hypothetical protein